MSTSGQNLDRQTRALTQAGCLRVFAVQRFFGKMSDLYGGTLRLQVRAVFADARTGMVLTSEHGSY